MSGPSSPQPPVPFSEFEYAFDPALSELFPPLPAPLPSSADLFSPSETTDLLGFLDNFNWDFEADLAVPDAPNPPQSSPVTSLAPSSQPSMSADCPSVLPILPMIISSNTVDDDALEYEEDGFSLGQNSLRCQSQSRTRSARRKDTSEPRQPARVKSLLSTPQKRLNHIMSEQRRRNAIRDGYAQLIALIAPAGTQTIDLPSRGRPKGSGTNSKGYTKGKSGVLFRAVEYCRWLEEGRDALREEVLRLEAAARMVGPR
ncbi:hypothetical protein EDD17DRAFT_1697781 [Pisolithus thermaeus]|nr:hypothetical protein EV401DRAFT_2052336 [Pisolithus croceorrhizus]KAI6136446.1 hypothetical protein F5141DRAFT_1208800 [Pisolithus sp. B1]KAI6161418.1 hypothetical protein EDD17DRAFT_1697781 [Pisolithus thermaeus]